MQWTRLDAALLLTVLTVPACSDADGGEWQGEVRDSAGIEIVSNPARGAWASGEEWSVIEDLRIGAAAGDEDYQFGQISGLDVGSDGRIYVMDQQAREVRVFDPEGDFLARIGRAGSGPGELSQGAGPVFITRGDTIVIPDPVQQRVTRYTADGEPAGGFPLPMTEGFAVKWMKTPDEDLVQQSMIMAFGPQAQQAAVEPRNLLLRRNTAGEILDTILQMPAGETMDFSGGQPRMTVFAPEPMWTVAEDGSLISGNNAQYRFRVHALDGEIRRIVEKHVERRQLTQADQNEFRRAIRKAWQDAGMPPQAMDVMSQGLDFAAHYPAYTNLLAGPDGTIWVQAVQTPETVVEQGGTFDIQDLGAPDWDVFDGDGRYVGVVRMPARFNPLLFSNGHIYGVLRDDLDVQHVARMTLNRGAASDR